MTEDEFLEVMEKTIKEIAAQPADRPDQPPGIVEASRKYLAWKDEKECSSTSKTSS